jgi:hypothetical protein
MPSCQPKTDRYLKACEATIRAMRVAAAWWRQPPGGRRDPDDVNPFALLKAAITVRDSAYAVATVAWELGHEPHLGALLVRLQAEADQAQADLTAALEQEQPSWPRPPK